MNKSTKILRSVAFVILALITAGLFDVFTAWAMSRLDPMAQETVGLVNAPWVSVYPTRRLAALDTAGIVGEAGTSDKGMTTGSTGD
jgi:hypothetical protein